MGKVFQVPQWPAWGRQLRERTWSISISAVLMGFLLNFLDIVSTGLLVFPKSPGSPFDDVRDSGMSLFVISIVTGQLVLSFGGSGYPGALSSMLVELIPLLRQIANDIRGTLDDGGGQGGDANQALIPTTLAAYALCSLLMGISFLGLGLARCGSVIGYFPYTVLQGTIGSLGLQLVIVSFELTESPETGAQMTPTRVALLAATIVPALWLSLSSRLAWILRLTRGTTKGARYILLFTAALAALFWIGAAADGRTDGPGLAGLQAHGWLFRGNGAGSQEQRLADVVRAAGYWRQFDFGRVRWDAIRGAAPAIAVLVLVGLLNLPIAAAALAASMPATALDVDRELLGSGAGNLLAGTVGALPNLIVFSYTKLFSDAKGGRREAFLVALLTASLIVVAPLVLPYTPTIAAAVVVCYVGLEMVVTPMLTTLTTLPWPEYAVVLGTFIASMKLGLAPGIAVGGGLALVVHAAYNVVDSSARTGHGNGSRGSSPALSARDRWNLGLATETGKFEAITVSTYETEGTLLDGCSEVVEKEQNTRGPVETVSLAGHCFFGSIPPFEKKLKLASRKLKSTGGLLVIDVSRVYRFETCMALSLKRRTGELLQANSRLEIVLAGLKPGFGAARDLRRSGVELAWIFEEDAEEDDEADEDSNSVQTDSEIVPLRAAQSTQQAVAWYLEKTTSLAQLSDHDVFKALEAMLMPRQWTHAFSILQQESREVVQLRDCTGIRTVLRRKGDILYSQGQDINAIYLVVHGHAIVRREGNIEEKEESPTAVPGRLSVKDYLRCWLQHVRSRLSRRAPSDDIEAVSTGSSGDVESGDVESGDMEGQQLRGTLLFPGGSFGLQELATGTADIRDVVVDSEYCALVSVDVEGPALHWARSLDYMLRSDNRTTAGCLVENQPVLV
ncbi:hypothetical protein F4780DRAFT_785414 [Xylariomycetidae sp. FL0641]|nr:hypothetical protein F4780DRAFT_785414 [Xylariomycetidae sp. FL0641]